MASKRQKQLETQPETQNTVTISKKKKKAGNSGSGEVCDSQSLPRDIITNDILTRVPVDKMDEIDQVIKSDGIVFCNADTKEEKGKILSLDVSKEKFYAIDYPKGVSDKCKLMEMGGSLCFLDYEDEEKESKRTPRNEWLEFSVDIMQNNNVPELFKDFENSSCFALVKDPTLKIIFWTTIERVFDVPNERGHISSYDPEIYSYDVELKTFSLICEHGGRIYVKWDLNSLLLFQSTIAVQTSTELLLCNS
ncbi:hypothetical protein MKW94_011690 [Papaver nudicaule]|uniref:Uncharacterized protein n=1 Tax=Papaver nudicaule TaxID=74823 RepID=A0AA42B0G1_PAPNU|nr:hypothetical protein [Papaver nudicaule]